MLCDQREIAIYFSSKIISRLLSEEHEVVYEEVAKSFEGHRKYELFDIGLFQKSFSRVGVEVHPFSFDKVLDQKFDPLLSMLLLQRGSFGDVPEFLTQLPKVCWVTAERIFPEVVLEVLPGHVGSVSLDVLKSLSNQSFPFFGFTVSKMKKSM